MSGKLNLSVNNIIFSLNEPLTNLYKFRNVS